MWQNVHSVGVVFSFKLLFSVLNWIHLFLISDLSFSQFVKVGKYDDITASIELELPTVNIYW